MSAESEVVQGLESDMPDTAGHLGPTEKSRAVPKVLKRKLVLPITGELDMPQAVRDTMNYRVEVVPLVLENGTAVERDELKPGEKPFAYEVLRKGNALEGLDPKFLVTLDRVGFNVLQDPQAAEKAIQKAQELAAQNLDMDTLIPGCGKATPENREKLLKSVFGDRLDVDRGTIEDAEQHAQHETTEQERSDLKRDTEKSQEPAAEQATEPSAAKSPEKTAQDNADLLKDWPSVSSDNAKKPDKVFEKHDPVPLLSHKNRPLVLDYGDHIAVTRRAMFGIGRRAQSKRENAVSTALLAARDRFGEPIHFSGDPAFVRETANMAVKLGIALEPGNDLAKHAYEQALQRAAAERGNVLEPSKSSPSPQKQVGAELA